MRSGKYRQKAMRYFNFAAAMDLSDIGGKYMMYSAYIAAIGGTTALVYGFAGLRDNNRQALISPQPAGGMVPTRLLPCDPRAEASRGRHRPRTTTYRLLEGEGLTFQHAEEVLTVSAAALTVTRPTPP